MYKTLAISMTNKCNAECKMCCFDCSPKKSTQLSEEEIMSLIDEANHIESITGIGFSGGEPLMRKDTLLKSIKYATSLGLRVSCISNGYWGSNYKIALNIVLALKEAGLSELSLSYDEFHEEFIAIKCIENVIKACGEVGIRCHVGIGITKHSKTPGVYIDEIGYSGFNAAYEYYPILPVGQAKENIPQQDFIKNFSKWGNRCVNSGLVAVLFDGNVYPCCSQIVHTTSLSLGNIRDKSLSEIINSSNGNIALFILWRNGFDWFVKTIENNNLKILSEDYVSPCHLCHEIFSDYVLMKQLIPFMKEEVKLYIGEKKCNS